jgi:phage repressor protein C with HTH and peptisase S24 domain
MDIAKRLDEAMKFAEITSQSALARASDVPQPTINRILKGVGKKGPEAHTLVQLARACNVNFDWLHEGKGPMARDRVGGESNSLRAVTVSESEADFIRVPLVTAVQLHGGQPGFVADEDQIESAELIVSRRWIDEKRLNADQLYAIKVTGDSMYPTIKRGNTVVINAGDRKPVDGEYFAVHSEGSPLIKRLERDGGIWYLASDNPAPKYRRRAVEDPETTIIGRMVKLEQDFI